MIQLNLPQREMEYLIKYSSNADLTPGEVVTQALRSHQLIVEGIYVEKDPGPPKQSSFDLLDYYL